MNAPLQANWLNSYWIKLMDDDKKRHIAILGSTGSIGTQALEVIEANRDHFVIEVLTANNNAELLVEQALKFIPMLL